MSHSSQCPEEKTLRDFVAGRLDAETSKSIGDHVAACASCRRLIADHGPQGKSSVTPREASGATAEEQGDDEGTRPREEDDWNESTSEVELHFLVPSQDPKSLGRIGTYEVQSVLGRGAMGIVVKAFDPSLCRAVAIKVLAPALAASPKAQRRFLREARAAAGINHPNVVTIHAVSENSGLPYLVMEYVAGPTLRQRMRSRKPFNITSLLAIGSQIAAGLAAAHQHGVIHRDIKPSNIMLEDGIERVKITDFGLALVVVDMSRITSQGLAVGTPAYMSPEQVNGELLDPRSDLFSLGCVLYALVAGKSPFQANHPLEIGRKVTEHQPPPLPEVDASVPKFFADIVSRLLAKNRQERYESADRVRDIFIRHLAEANLGHYGHLTPVGRAAPARGGRKWQLGAVAALLVVLIGAGVAWQTGLFQSNDDFADGSSFRAPALITVSQTGEADARSLAAALRKAGPGTTIRILDAAVYRGPVVVDDPDRLRGLVIDAPRRAILENPSSGAPVLSIVGTPDVVLRGARIHARKNQHCLAISEECPGLDIERVDLIQPSTSTYAAVVFWPATHGARDRPMVVRQSLIRCGAIGITLLGKKDRPVSWLRVEGCRFSGPGCHLTVETAVHNLDIVKNIFTDGGCGIGFQMDLPRQCAAIRIANNTFFSMKNWLAFTSSVLEQKDMSFSRNLVIQTEGIQLNNHDLTQVAPHWFRENWWEPAPMADPGLVKLVADPRKEVMLLSRDPARSDFLQPSPGSMPAQDYIGALAPGKRALPDNRNP